MAYPSVISLGKTVPPLLNTFDFTIESRVREILRLAYEEVLSLEEILKILDGPTRSSSNEMLNDLDGEIREAVCRLEDLLETHLSNSLISRSTESTGDEKNSPIPFSPGVQELEEHVDSLTQVLRKLLLVAVPKVFREVRGLLTDGESKLRTVLLHGYRSGIGSTIIAKEIFEDVHILELFDCCAWVTASLQKSSRSEEIAVAILAQIDHPGDFDLKKERDEEIREYLKECLKDNNNGSRVLLTKNSGAQADLKIDVDDELRATTDNFNQIAKEVSGIIKDVQASKLLDNVNAISSTFDFSVKKSEMVKLSDEVETIKNMLLGGPWASKFGIVSLVGMAGIGKTALAKEIFEDPSILDYFELCAWVTLGPRYYPQFVPALILSQLHPSIDIDDIDIDEINWQKFEELRHHLHKSLKGMKYLIVLDDLWYTKVFRYCMEESFPDENNGSRVLLTTREVSLFDQNFMVHRKRFLNEEESWQLLHQKVFGEGLCDPELEKAGKKIAKSCEGLPLTIVTVAKILSKEEKTIEYWNKVAEKQNSVFKDAYDQMVKVLYPSYKFLTPKLKTCFLYMGVFPQTCKIPVCRLIKLWSTESFLELTWSWSFEGLEFLENLDSSSLLMVNRENYNDQIKTCWLHSAFWHLSVTEAEKNKFFHHLNRFVDGLAEGMKGQRRLCVHNNILFGIKDVRNALSSTSTVRSLLCTGPHHQYPVPICFNWILLRILDALTVRFYEFPVEVVKLVHLRYLALTCNGKLPPSISKLLNLQFLLVRRHLSIKIPGDWGYLPMEIWAMKELKHLQVMGSNLPDPCNTVSLHLLTLSDVTVRSCTEVVLKKICFLKKLGIRIELAPAAIEPLGCLNLISRLKELKSLKCVVVNPELNTKVVALPAPISMFPSSLKKLSLSGFAYPWEYMTKIASLPYLEVLKLQCYAFRGPEWVTHKGEFKSLKYLLVEDTDLVYWRADGECCPILAHLIIRHCYKLKEIPSDSLCHVKKMEIPSISELMEEDEKEKDE